MPLTSPPKMTIKLIGEKVASLDREVKYLLNKARFSQPLKKKAEKEKSKVNETAQNNTEQSKYFLIFMFYVMVTIATFVSY